MLDEHFNAKLGDFGFTVELHSTAHGRTLVTAPFVARTQGYFAPEIKISPKSDVYSYGVVVFHTFDIIRHVKSLFS